MSAHIPGTGQVLARVRDVTVDHGATRALDGVSLEVAAGEVVALAGPSGAGKTTLLRLLAGTLAPTGGHVELDGRHVDRVSPRDRPRLVGLMPQQLDLVPHLAVKHNVQAGLLGRWSLLRSLVALLLPLEERAARDAITRVGLDGRFRERTGRLSGGEQQRVALARLLVQDPRLILADEPVASLDPARADDLLALVRAAASTPERGLVVSLHMPDLARRHADRVVGLRDGRIVLDAPSTEVTDGELQELYELDGEAAGETHPSANGQVRARPRTRDVPHGPF